MTCDDFLGPAAHDFETWQMLAGCGLRAGDLSRLQQATFFLPTRTRFFDASGAIPATTNPIPTAGALCVPSQRCVRTITLPSKPVPRQCCPPACFDWYDHSIELQSPAPGRGACSRCMNILSVPTPRVPLALHGSNWRHSQPRWCLCVPQLFGQFILKLSGTRSPGVPSCGTCRMCGMRPWKHRSLQTPCSWFQTQHNLPPTGSRRLVAVRLSLLLFLRTFWPNCWVRYRSSSPSRGVAFYSWTSCPILALGQ